MAQPTEAYLLAFERIIRQRNEIDAKIRQLHNLLRLQVILTGALVVVGLALLAVYVWSR